MNKLIRWVAPWVLGSSLVLVGCGSNNPRVERVDVNQEIALTDRWNDEDSRLVSQEMMQDMLTFPWISRYKTDSDDDRKPTVIIQSIRNKTDEHIPTETFVNDIKRALLRSGDVDFVVSGDERDFIREERKDQELNASSETQAAMGQEVGANFALSGTINAFIDQLGKTKVKTYQVDLKLINMTTNREVWNGQKKMKKKMTR
ncbi:penicillin-binding protein activator LpoB [Oceanospirillum beijerinckii]|uniref:penicillin-binding protein activator LpoB n=1 Tax=Oceanospirillum beijerinckii TaxID=64976 RepID=UPI0003F94BA9|nr:penicillin-binding protein activator LpoB [Oceanospirillum beijerinckii]MAC48567.1 penicillin-binding protein activator LpoB [Oceanospirillum sp.]